MQGVQTYSDQKSLKDVGTSANLLDLSVTSHLGPTPINIDVDNIAVKDDCGDSGVFPVKESNLSPRSDRMNRFLNDVTAVQNQDQANMLQYRYIHTYNEREIDNDFLTDDFTFL